MCRKAQVAAGQQPHVHINMHSSTHWGPEVVLGDVALQLLKRPADATQCHMLIMLVTARSSTWRAVSGRVYYPGSTCVFLWYTLGSEPV